MATASVIAQLADTLDGLIWRARGLGPEALPLILVLNPGLAALGPILPTGTQVVLPDLPRSTEPPVLDIVQLWN